MLLILLSQVLFSQEPDPTEISTNDISTTETTEKIEDGDTALSNSDEAPQQKSDVAMISVELVLNNGVRLAGEIPAQEAISWDPNRTGTIHLYIEDQSPVELSYETISAIDTKFPAQQGSSPSNQDSSQQNETINKNVSPQGFSYQNPAASRYLYSPSSIGLQKGQGYVSQKLFFTTGVYAITDNITILFGGLGPFVTVLGGKVSTKIGDKLYISAGTETFFLPFSAFDSTSLGANISFAGVTYGDLDRHLSINSGYLQTSSVVDSQFLRGVPLVVSGHTRVAERVALVSENWLLLDPSTTNQFKLALGSLAFRIIGRRDVNAQVRGRLITKSGYPRSTWDIGLVVAHGARQENTYIGGQQLTTEFAFPFTFGPIPWIDYTWHFGPARR